MRKAILTLAAASTAVVGAGAALIMEFEGKRNAAYLDPVGIPTICYGHTGPEVRMSLRYTDAQCAAILQKDIATHRAGLAKCITRRLNENQWAALTSFAFNVGVSKACGSTLVRKANMGDFAGASAEFPKWKNAGGRVLPGLVRRRAAERALWDRAPLQGTRDVKVTYVFLAQ